GRQPRGDMGRHGAGRGGEERPLPAAGYLTGGRQRARAGPPAPARDRAGAAGHASVAVARRCDVAGSAFRAGGALARGRPGGGGRRGRAAVDRRPRRRRHQGAIRGGGRHRWGRAGELLRAAVRTSPRRRRRGERRSARRGEAPPGGRAAAEREGARRDPAAGARRTGDAAGAGGAMKTLARLASALTLVALPLAAPASTPLETYVELWRALSAKVNLPEAVDHVQGGEAGVVLRPRGSALWMRLGYRVDGAQLGGGSRSESVEAVSFAVGIGPR